MNHEIVFNVIHFSYTLFNYISLKLNRPVLKSLSEEEIGKYLKKHRRYTKFPYILEACGSLGLWKIHKQVFKNLLELEQNIPLLGNL